MRYLSIDFGLKRTGLAVTDPAGTLAFPLKTIHKKNNKQFWEELLGTIEQERVQALVIGIPYDLYGKDAESTKQAKNFVKRLQRRCPLPVYLINETCSTLEAREHLKQADVPLNKAKDYLDQQAAVVILESYLNS